MSSEVEMRSAAQRQANQRLNELHHREEEESSLLNGDGLPRKTNAASPLDRLANGGGSSSSNRSSLSKDFVICQSAWSRLSSPTRSIFLLVAAALLIFAAYEFGMDEGVREQEREDATAGIMDLWKPLKVFGGDENHDGGHDGDHDHGDSNHDHGGIAIEAEEEEYTHGDDGASRYDIKEGNSGRTHREFTKDNLVGVREKANELIATLHYYDGGEEKARPMLVRSWQAGSMALG
mmetsp:Transcript_13198/g.28030  ORF Transcript_13198/g.28030 Transcript_13198/m.28030 type:complete len:235 (+) Transcript_13198:161-865(+)